MKLFNKNSGGRRRWAITDRMFFSLFITGSVIEFSQVGAGFVDGLVISRFLGPLAMAAEGIVHPLYSILGILSGLIAAGMQVKCAHLLGRGDQKDFSKFVSASLAAGAVVSVLFTAFALAFTKPFAAFLGARGSASDLLEPASQYLAGVGVGIPALIMSAILAPALQLDSGRKTVQTGALIDTAVNIVFDLISVKAGWGIFGIGLSTAISSWANLLYLCLFFLKKDRMLRIVRPDVPFKEFIFMLADGSEKAVKRLANTLRPIVLNAVIISYGGAMAMSVLSVRNNFSDFAEIFGAGIASAVALLAGVYYGEVNGEGIEEVSGYMHRMVLIFTGAVCGIMLVFAKPVASLYVARDEEIFGMTVFAIRILALQIPLQALLACRIKYLQAVHKTLNMNLLIIASKAVLILISAFILGKLFGVYGILSCYTVSDALSLLAVYIFYAVKKGGKLPSKQDFLNLPDEFYPGPGDVISLDIRDMDEVTLGSEQIMRFCKGHGTDSKTAYFAALCFEELASNVAEHGFPKCPFDDPMIDLRAVITGGSLVLRMRDNCPQYDVAKAIAAVNEDESDPVHNIGIRIVSKTASDVLYVRTFDTNSIIVKF